METIAKRTNLTAEEILEKARNYFDGNFGFEMKDEVSDCCIGFRNSIGFVNVKVRAIGDGNEVQLRSREYEHQARAFIRNL